MRSNFVVLLDLVVAAAAACGAVMLRDTRRLRDLTPDPIFTLLAPIMVAPSAGTKCHIRRSGTFAHLPRIVPMSGVARRATYAPAIGV